MKLDFSLLEGLELSRVVEPSDASWNPGLIRMGSEEVKKIKNKKNHVRKLSQSNGILDICLY